MKRLMFQSFMAMEKTISFRHHSSGISFARKKSDLMDELFWLKKKVNFQGSWSNVKALETLKMTYNGPFFLRVGDGDHGSKISFRLHWRFQQKKTTESCCITCREELGRIIQVIQVVLCCYENGIFFAETHPKSWKIIDLPQPLGVLPLPSWLEGWSCFSGTSYPNPWNIILGRVFEWRPNDKKDCGMTHEMIGSAILQEWSHWVWKNPFFER